MLFLNQIRDWIKDFDAAENYYIGKMNDKEKSLGIFQLSPRPPTRAIGQDSSYEVRRISIKLHWNKNQNESERAAKVLGHLKTTFTNVFNTIKNIVQKFLAALNSLIDFVTHVFKGEWDKAWNDIKSCFANSFGMIGEVAKGTFNLMIDCVNTVWASIYDFVAGIANGFGGILEKIGSALGQDWSFTMPSQPAYIPHLAKGGLVKAPTLAMVGDNKGAAHDPEVVSPLSKLESMLHSNDPEIIRLLMRIITLLEHDENTYQNNIYLDSEVIERKLVKVRKSASAARRRTGYSRETSQKDNCFELNYRNAKAAGLDVGAY